MNREMKYKCKKCGRTRIKTFHVCKIKLNKNEIERYKEETKRETIWKENTAKYADNK